MALSTPRLTGIVNLLTAFPQLATGLLLARYAKEPSIEYRLRGLPQQLLDMLAAASRAMDTGLLDTIVSRLASRKDFVEAHVEAVASCLLEYEPRYLAAAATILEYMSERGVRLATGVSCIEKPFSTRLARLAGAEEKPLRSCDAVFIYEYRYEDPDDPTVDEEEEYYCAPLWLVNAYPLLVRRLGGTEYTETAMGAVRAVHASKPPCYAVLRALAVHGLHVLERVQRVLRDSIGYNALDCTVEGVMEQDAVNIALLRGIRDRLRGFEEEVYGEPPEGYTYDTGLGAYRAPEGREFLAYGLGGLTTLMLAGGLRERARVAVRALDHEKRYVEALARWAELHHGIVVEAGPW